VNIREDSQYRYSFYLRNSAAIFSCGLGLAVRPLYLPSILALEMPSDCRGADLHNFAGDNRQHIQYHAVNSGEHALCKFISAGIDELMRGWQIKCHYITLPDI